MKQMIRFRGVHYFDFFMTFQGHVACLNLPLTGPHSEALAKIPTKLLLHVKILYLKASKPEFGAIWRIPTYQKLDFSFAYKFSHS